MGVFQRNGAWYIRYRIPGTNKKKWERVGPSKRQAEILWAKRKLERLNPQPTPTAKPPLLHPLLDRYTEHIQTIRAQSSLAGLRWIITKLRLLPNCRADNLSLDTVHKWVYTLYSANLHAGTIHNCWTELVRLYSLATKEWGLFAHNPLFGAKFPLKVHNERTRFLNPSEVTRFLETLPWPWSGFARVAIYTGLRKTEIYRLTWADVNFELHTLQVRHGKGDKFRTVPLVAPLEAYLRALPRHSDYLFTSQRRDGYHAANRRGWKQTLETLGIEDFRFHDLRHTTATLLRMAGVDLQTIGEILGHSNLKHTQRYAHLPQKSRHKALEKLVTSITNSDSQLPQQLPKPTAPNERQPGRKKGKHPGNVA